MENIHENQAGEALAHGYGLKVRGGGGGRRSITISDKSPGSIERAFGVVK